MITCEKRPSDMSGWNFGPSFDGRLETFKKRNNDKDANQKFDIF